MATVLITGASRGIGLELARQYRDRGDTVVAACREATPALEALGVKVVEGADVTDETGVERMTAAGTAWRRWIVQRAAGSPRAWHGRSRGARTVTIRGRDGARPHKVDRCR